VRPILEERCALDHWLGLRLDPEWGLVARGIPQANPAVRRVRRDAGKEAGLVEPFVLVIWLWVGMRFEKVRIQNLGRSECIELKFQIASNHAHAHGKCVGAGRITPMICGFAGCCAFISPAAEL
jgi:hypothetical protein